MKKHEAEMVALKASAIHWYENTTNKWLCGPKDRTNWIVGPIYGDSCALCQLHGDKECIKCIARGDYGEMVNCCQGRWKRARDRLYTREFVRAAWDIVDFLAELYVRETGKTLRLGDFVYYLTER